MNNELKFNVSDQQNDIYHLREQCDIDDEAGVQEITATITLMKNNKALCCTISSPPDVLTFVNRRFLEFLSSNLVLRGIQNPTLNNMNHT